MLIFLSSCARDSPPNGIPRVFAMNWISVSVIALLGLLARTLPLVFLLRPDAVTGRLVPDLRDPDLRDFRDRRAAAAPLIDRRLVLMSYI